MSCLLPEWLGGICNPPVSFGDFFCFVCFSFCCTNTVCVDLLMLCIEKLQGGQQKNKQIVVWKTSRSKITDATNPISVHHLKLHKERLIWDSVVEFGEEQIMNCLGLESQSLGLECNDLWPAKQRLGPTSAVNSIKCFQVDIHSVLKWSETSECLEGLTWS